MLVYRLTGAFFFAAAGNVAVILERLPIPPRAVSLPARAWRAEIWRLRRGGPLPYGVAICGGVLLTLAG